MVDRRLFILGKEFSLYPDILKYINRWLIKFESQPYQMKFQSCLQDMKESIEYHKQIYILERVTRSRPIFSNTGEYYPMGDNIPRPTPKSKKALKREYQNFYLGGYIVTKNFLDKSEYSKTLKYHKTHFYKDNCPFCQLRNYCLPRDPKTGKKKLIFTKSFMKKLNGLLK